MKCLNTCLLCCLVMVAASSVAWGADKILVASLKPSKAVLYVSRADGSGELALLPPGTFDYDPSWSPQGRLDRLHL